MRKPSFFQKLFFSYSAIIFILTALIYYFSFNVIYSDKIENLQSQLKNEAVLLESQFKKDFINRDYLKIDQNVKSLRKRIKTRITFVDSAGVVIADSEKDPAQMNNHLSRPEIIQSSSEAFGYSIRYSITTQKEMLYLSKPIYVKSQIIGFIRTSLWMDDVDSLIVNLKNDFFSSVLYMLIFALIFALFITKTLSKPIRKLTEFAKRLPKEKFSTRIELNEQTELGELAERLNSMAHEIQHLFNSLEKEKEELSAIINNIREGLLVIEETGIVQLANKSFKQFFKQTIAKNKYYWEIIHNNQFNELIKRHQNTREFISETIQFDEFYFRISSTYLPVNKETICLFHDITEQKKLEQAKREFVSNVSHELRTPLTSIKGFAETLEEDESDPSKKRHFEIIIRNTDRLISMVKDLSMLSNLENNSTNFERTDTNLNDILMNVSKIFIPKIRDTNTSISFDCDPKIYLKVDQYKIEQVFINLIDNAVKYAESSEIELSVNEHSDSVQIEISDNGQGIKKEHLTRLFERFYVVDAARSRKTGGTGLGLSIVKHIIQLHSGTITVKSVLGSGTSFEINLPKI